MALTVFAPLIVLRSNNQIFREMKEQTILELIKYLEAAQDGIQDKVSNILTRLKDSTMLNLIIQKRESMFRANRMQDGLKVIEISMLSMQALMSVMILARENYFKQSNASTHV